MKMCCLLFLFCEKKVSKSREASFFLFFFLHSHYLTFFAALLHIYLLIFYFSLNGNLLSVQSPASYIQTCHLCRPSIHKYVVQVSIITRVPIIDVTILRPQSISSSAFVCLVMMTLVFSNVYQFVPRFLLTVEVETAITTKSSLQICPLALLLLQSSASTSLFSSPDSTGHLKPGGAGILFLSSVRVFSIPSPISLVECVAKAAVYLC